MGMDWSVSISIYLTSYKMEDGQKESDFIF